MVTLKVRSLIFFPSRGDIVIVTDPVNKSELEELSAVGWQPVPEKWRGLFSPNKTEIAASGFFHDYSVNLKRRGTVSLTKENRLKDEPAIFAGRQYISVKGNFECDLKKIENPEKYGSKFSIECH